MRFERLFKLTVAMTVLSLIYINMQMQIIDLAYQGKEREKHLRQLMDKHGHVNYQILALKSASNIGGKILNDESDLRFAGQQNIVRVSTQEVAQNEPMIASRPLRERANQLLSLLSFSAQAEARTK